MTSDRINEVFRTLGKLLYLDQIGVTYGSGVKAAVVALQEQNAAASGAADPYAELQSFIGPALTSTRQVVQALDRVPLIARSAVESYLRAVAPELGHTASSAPATILSTLAGEMVSAGESVEPSGTFAEYISGGWSVELPAAEPATLPDSLITVAIVE